MEHGGRKKNVFVKCHKPDLVLLLSIWELQFNTVCVSIFYTTGCWLLDSDWFDKNEPNMITFLPNAAKKEAAKALTPWRCPEVSNKTFAASFVGCGVEKLWFKLFGPAHPTDAHLDLDFIISRDIPIRSRCVCRYKLSEFWPALLYLKLNVFPMHCISHCPIVAMSQTHAISWAGKWLTDLSRPN